MFINDSKASNIDVQKKSDFIISENKFIKMNKTLIICFLIVLVEIGCERANPKDADLLKTKWELTSIQATQINAITNYPGDAAKKISIVFNDLSNDIGFSGVCNGGAGKYSYTSGSGEIKITELNTTLIGCKYDEWEAYAVQNLHNAFSYKINGNNLVVYSHGDYNLYFTKN